MREAPIDKTLTIMEIVASARRPLTVTEISTSAKLPIPTVHRLVRQLVERGLFKRHLTSKRVMPGVRLVTLGVESIQTSLYADKPHALLKSLVVQIGEFAQISMVVDSELICVDAAAVHRPLGLHLEQGNKAPLHCTSIGKLYLSDLADDEFSTWLRAAKLKPFTEHTIANATELRRHCQEIRARGWASCNEELNLGVVGCGVRLPLRNSSGFIGLCISAPAARMKHDTIIGYVPTLRKFAKEITQVFEKQSHAD